FEWVELGEQRGLNAGAGLVAGPERVAKRLDDVIGGHANVSRAGLDHLQNCIQHADHRAEGLILALVKAPKSVKVPEQFVGPVDQMNNQLVARSGVVTWGSSGGWHSDLYQILRQRPTKIRRRVLTLGEGSADFR